MPKGIMCDIKHLSLRMSSNNNHVNLIYNSC